MLIQTAFFCSGLCMILVRDPLDGHMGNHDKRKNIELQMSIKALHETKSH